MKIDTFITLYKTKKTDEDKLNAIKQIMKNKRVSYADKVDRAGIIAKNSYHEKQKDINGEEREVFFQNSAAKYMLYSLTLVDLYTDLEIDFKQSLELFEKINGEMLDMIIMSIDERERKEFQMLLEFACDDLMVNEYEPHAFVREQVDRFGSLIGTVLVPILENIDVNKIEEIMKQINK